PFCGRGRRPGVSAGARGPSPASRHGLRSPAFERARRPSVNRINPNPFTTRPEIVGTFGVVTSTHWIATAVGMSILETGGNAFDAAVATAFTLQTVEPHLNRPGGEGPLILHDTRRQRTAMIFRP